MNKKRIVLYLCAAAALIYSFSSFFSPRDREETELPPVESIAPDTAAVAEQTVLEQRDVFLLIAEDGYINLYQKGSRNALLYSVRLDLSLFPAKDAEMLCDGIEFDSQEEAYSVLENFVG